LHFVVPRLELITGKALNVAPPGYEVLFDVFRDSWNFEHGWARPDDPARAQVVKRDAHTLKIEGAALKAGITAADDPKQLITEFLLQRIESGDVSNRADVLASLLETGVEINRQGKDYISIRSEPGAKPIRLKGEIYGEGFNVSVDRAASIHAELRKQLGQQAKEQDQGGRSSDPRGDIERARAARACLAGLVERRADYNAGRYQQGSRVNPADIHGGECICEAVAGQNDSCNPTAADGDRVGDNQEHKAGSLANQSTPIGGGSRLPDAFIDDMGIHPGSVLGDQNHGSHNGERPEIHSHSDAGLVHVPDARQSIFALLTKKLGGFYDIVREGIGRRIRGAVEAIRGGFEAISASHRELEIASAELGRTSAELEQSCQQLEQQAERACSVLKVSRDDELERFKSQISLAEYAQAQGYEIDHRESGRASLVMRNGDDKIIVATDADGHGIYFSVRDDADNGSVIDFVQMRQGLNLGQVRKELRGWCPGSSSYSPVTTSAADRPRKQEPSS
jgi:hypothetical protein